MTLHATLNTKSFLKSPDQELSEYIVLANGTQIFTRLDFWEVYGELKHNFSSRNF